MFKNKIAISKNFLIAICFISLILFAVNTVNAIDLNDSVSDGNALGIESSNGINAIDKDKLGNSQQDMLSQANTITLNNGKFSDIQDAINSKLNDGDTLILNGEFTTNKAESHIIIYKNITFTSTSNGILNAKNLSSIFIVENSGSGSSFSNLIFKNGNGLYGGAIRILAKDVTIDNCQFQDNYASSGGGAIYTDYYVEKNPDFGRNLLIKNSQFKNNRAAVAAGAIGAYGYNTRILNCLFESNSVYNKNGGGVYGGAMQVGKEEYITNSIIKNCKFINNKAISITGTKLSHGGASCLRNSVTYENCWFDGNSADFGGALTAHSSGTIKNCTFNSNTANDYGGAISNVEGIQSMNLKIIDCDFNSNSAPYGGAVRLTGNSITIDDCNFDKNYASIDGGAVFVETKIIDILDSNFNYNSAENNGGAVFINGESTNVQNSNFRYNTAIANPKVKNDGLGGAIYINGSSDTVNNNKFEYNVARNGSAIYYDNSGKNLKITNNVMFKNQAWVYALPIYAKDIYYGENADVGAIIYGGNNIADYDNLAVSNAIYNAASNKHIVVNGEIPVSGATNSGQLYQDSREYNINILLTVKHSDGTVVYNKTLKSNYLGEITTKLNNLKVGTYTVTAKHFEDNYYKAIVNQTTFVVKPKIDVSVSKNTQYSEFNYHDQVVWTINVVNNGPNDASDVKVNDVLPVGLVFQSYSASAGSYANGVWDIGNLAKGKTVTIKITTLINKTGSITNKATVNAKEFDWNTTNNQDSQKITVPKAIDLSIVKVANVTAPKYGDLVKWTLTVKNNGPDIAHDVIVSDVLPAGLTFKSSNGNYANSKWSVGTLNVGQSKSLEIVTSVTATGNIENTATVSGNEYDYDLTNNKASKTINVAKAADLEIIKTVDNDSPNYGSLVKWTVTVRNNGPDAASGVRVSDVLPVGLVYQSYSASVGSYANGVWDIGNLAKGKSVTLSIVCKINKTGSIKNVASVSGNEFDVDLTNNKGDASVKVAKAVDLSVVKSVNNSAPNYGGLVKWTVTVRNNGPDAATGVVLSDVLPAGLVVKSASGNFVDGKWVIGSLASGKSQSFEVVTLVNKTGSLTNKVSVSGNEYDYNPKNNNASKSINVAKAADLSVIKSVNETSPNYLSLVKWTVTVRNNGPDAASGVRVSDVLPVGLVYQSYSTSVGSYTNGVWDIGNLAKGKSVTLSIVCKINKTGSIKNVASVSGNEFDVDLTNNKGDASVKVAKAVDLSVVKSVNNSAPNYGGLVKWTVTVRNNGPDAATGVVLSDVLPAGLVVKSASGNFVDGKWVIGSLASGKSQSFEVVTLVNKTGSLTNKVSVSGNEYDYNPKNNNASKSINVAKAADLSVIKSVNETSPNYLSLVKWTVTVRNNGPDAASGVRVSDVLPVGLVYQSYSTSVGSYTNGVWDIGNLAKGKSVTLSIVCKINKTGSIKNVASVSGNEFDVDLTNNKGDASVKVAKAVDLSVVKSVNNSAPNYGGLVKWTVTVRNNGPDAATGVVLSDVLPAGLVVKSASGNFVDGKWVIGSLASGKSQSFEVVTLVNKTGSLTNKVSVSGNEYDYNPKNNNASKSINVAKAADLSVIKSVNETSPNYLSLVKWTVTVRNNGPDAASGVRVSDVLPVGLVYQSYSTSVGSYTNGVWDIGNLAKGKSVTLSIVCKINKTGSIKNVASVSGNEFDVDLTNNKGDASVKVAKAADLSVIKSVNETSPNYLSLVKWTVTVRNNGPDAASGVRVSDVLPVGLVYQSSSASVGSYANGVWDIGNLAKGKSVTLSIVCKINKTGSIKNVASVSGNEFDVDLTNNKGDASVKVAKAADLSVIKSVNETSPNYLSLVKWTVTVRNNGPDAASGVRVSDVLPAGLVVKSASGNFVDGKWVIGSLASGKSQSFEVVTLVNKTGSLTNKVSVSGNEYDYNPKNNNASKSIKVPKAADLSVIKSVNETSPNYLSLVKWTVTVRNNGPDAATGVVLSDVLPVGLVYQSYSASVGSYANGVWDIGNLANGKTVTLTIISKVGSTGSINNIVNVSGNEYDINKTNNVNNKIIDVPKACDLQIIKSVNDSTPNYHKLVKWTIIVNNNGPDNATGVLVEDILPQDLVIISSNANYTNGKWFIGKLNAFSSKILEITTLINKTGLLINNANISGNEYDFNKSNNYDDSSIDVLPSSDLEIQKIVGNKNPLYNDTVKWIIIVKNNGPDKATGVKVNETLADSFELINSKLSKGLYINGIWTIGDLNVGEKVYMELITKIVKTGNFTNVVNVDGNEYDHNTSNNYANKSINVYPAVDLQITKKVNNSSPNYNDLVKWTVTVRNNGPDKANVIEIADILPKGLEFVGYNSTKGYYVDGFWKFCCLEVGETQSLDIVTRVKSIGNIKNIVSANAREYDYNPDNNKDESEITVPPAADLQITKLVNQSVVNYTNLVKWTLVVRNNGPNEATRVVVMDKLPEGLTFVSAQGDGTYSTAGTWHIGNIASGQSKELTIITRCDKVGESTNVAIVKGDQYDYNSTNDKGEKTIVVPSAADLAITKTVSKAQYFVDDVIKYTIEIVNNGPSTAENITVKEFMDDSLILKSVFAASGDYDNVNHIWHIKSLANGEKTYLNINAIATGEGLVNNMVSVISHTFDNNLKNNYAECIVEIIKKIIDPNSVLNPGLHSRFSNHNSLEKDLCMIAKSGIEMKSTGLPIGLLFAIALISIGFCTSNISRKR